MAVFFKNESAYLELGKFLQKKRDHFRDGMQQTPLKPLPSSGSCFQLYSFGEISAESERDFAIKLTEQAGVTAIPVSAFYQQPMDHQVLRFCFSKREATLDEAIERLVRFFRQ